MISIFVVAVGGAIGAAMRYSISLFLVAEKSVSTGFPYNTLVVNLTGSFFAGFIYSFFSRMNIPENIKLFIIVGMLGAFTTFSAFSLENIKLLKSGALKIAVINIAASNLFGIMLAAAGYFIARQIFLTATATS